MTWIRLQIRNFQSLKAVDLDLGKLTVIQGPSSSGKSAVTRAIRLLTSNKAGNAYVTRGQVNALVAVTLEDGRRVVISRGKESKYVIGEDTYTKLGTGVPDAAATALGIPPGDAPNFAGQFDRPFLLDQAGTTASASVLGDLTNVSLLFEASREANRRHLAGAAQLRQIETQISTLETQLSVLEDPEPYELAAVALADLASQVQVLTSQRSALQNAAQRVNILTTQVGQPAPEPLDTTAVDAVSSLMTLRLPLAQLTQNIVRMEAQTVTLTRATESVQEALRLVTEEYEDVLRQVGKCPTCGQTLPEEHTHVG